MAQEIFQAKVIPGWTDFETYIEFSDHEIAGLDMVFIKSSYVYHTAQDDLAHVTAGTLQHVGNNLLPTVCNGQLALSSRLACISGPVRRVFRRLGAFLIVISDADMAEVSTCVLRHSCCYWISVMLRQATRRIVRGLLASLAHSHSKLLCSSAGSLPLSLLGFCLQYSLHSMAWYAHFNITCLLFGVSSLVGVLSSRLLCIGILPQELKLKTGGDTASSDQLPTCSFGSQADRAALLFHTVIMLLFALRGFQSAYVFAVPAILTVFGNAAQSLRICDSILPCSTFPVYVSLLSAVAVALNCEIYLALSSFFLPITGRLGGVVQTDLLISVLLGLASSFVIILPTSSMHRRSSIASVNTMRPALFSSITIAAVLACFLFLQHPFSATAPKRLFMLDTTRKFFGKPPAVGLPPPLKNEDNGLWVIPFDIRGLSPDIDELHIPELMTEGKRLALCEPDSVYCGWPWYFPIQEMIGPTTWFVPYNTSIAKRQQQFRANAKLSLSLIGEEHSKDLASLAFEVLARRT